MSPGVLGREGAEHDEMKIAGRPSSKALQGMSMIGSTDFFVLVSLRLNTCAEALDNTPVMSQCKEIDDSEAERLGWRTTHVGMTEQV